MISFSGSVFASVMTLENKTNSKHWLTTNHPPPAAVIHYAKGLGKQNKQKTRHKKLVTPVESHASAVSLLKRAENSVI